MKQGSGKTTDPSGPVPFSPAGKPSAIHEARTQARLGLASLLRSAKIPAAKHHRTHVRLAERKPPHRHTPRQAREKLCCDGLVSFCYAVFATFLFVQSLTLQEDLDVDRPSLAINSGSTNHLCVQRLLGRYVYFKHALALSFEFPQRPIGLILIRRFRILT